VSYRHWHRVLAHALTGADDPAWGEQADVDLDVLVAWAERHRGEIDAVRRQRAAVGEPWPVAPPASLSDGLPWARYAAMLQRLRDRAGLTGVVPATARPAERSGRPDPELQRLLADRPPHW